MTDKQRLALLSKAVRELQLTQQGHVQWVQGGKKPSHWKNADKYLHQLAADLSEPPTPVIRLPDLGPMWKGGKSVLQMSPTHNTDGIDFYPAYDDAFVEGREIIAIEDITVSRSSSSKPGLAFYCVGEPWHHGNKVYHLKYWYGHLDRTHNAGEHFKKGSVVGRVCHNTIGGGPHAHLGINIEELVGRGEQLLFGKNGNGPDYTLGAPTVGQQLTKLLADV